MPAVIEFTTVAPSPSGKDTPVSHWYAIVEEVAVSGTAASTTIVTVEDAINSVIRVHNTESSPIWVTFDGTAASTTNGRFIPANTTQDFGGVPAGNTVSVIADS